MKFILFFLFSFASQIEFSYSVTCRASQCTGFECGFEEACKDCTCKDDYCIATFNTRDGQTYPTGQGCISSKLFGNLENGCYYDRDTIVCQCNSDNCNDKSTSPIYPNGQTTISCMQEERRNRTRICDGYVCRTSEFFHEERGECDLDSGPFLDNFAQISLNKFPGNKFCILQPFGNRSEITCYCNGESACNNATLIEWGQTQIANSLGQSSVDCWESGFRRENKTVVKGQYCYRFQNGNESFYGALAFAPYDASFLKGSIGCKIIQGMRKGETQEICLCQSNLCNEGAIPTVPGGTGSNEKIPKFTLLFAFQAILLFLLQ